MCQKCCKRTVLVQLTVEDVVTCFWNTFTSMQHTIAHGKIEVAQRLTATSAEIKSDSRRDGVSNSDNVETHWPKHTVRKTRSDRDRHHCYSCRSIWATTHFELLEITPKFHGTSYTQTCPTPNRCCLACCGSRLCQNNGTEITPLDTQTVSSVIITHGMITCIIQTEVHWSVAPATCAYKHMLLLLCPDRRP